MINFIKNLFRANLANSLITQKMNFIESNKTYAFGSKNRNKSFYIIKRKFNANGMFSNLRFVLDHLIYAKKKNFIPIIDMQNFPTVYNEKKKIYNSYNSWNYYFKSINNYDLKEIYNSKNVIFSSDSTLRKLEIDKDKYAQKFCKKYIKLNKSIINKYKLLEKNIFKKKVKVMGVHIRGTLQRIVTGHSLPPKPKDIVMECNEIFNKYSCKKIFLVTEDLIYYKKFKSFFKDKLITLNTPRSKPNILGNHNEHFTKYNRSLHRYKLGEESIIDTLLLSKTNVFLYTDSNIWRFSVIFSKNKQIKYEFITKKNSKNFLLSRWKWYLHYYLPFIFGDIKYKLKRNK